MVPRTVALSVAIVALRIATAHADAGPPLRRCGHAAVFGGRELLTGPDGAAVAVSGVTRTPVVVMTPGGVAPIEGEPVALSLVSWAELTVWARTRDLEPVVREPVVLAAQPAQAGAQVPTRTPAIRLLRGARVQVLRRRGDVVQVQLIERGVRARGWVPARAIGTVYALVDEEVPAGRAVRIPVDARLLARPGGPVLVQLAARPWEDRADAVELERRNGHVLVVVPRVGWGAIGWVRADRVAAVEESSDEGDEGGLVGVEGGVEGGGPGAPAMLRLTAGMPLLHAPGGVAFGRLTSPGSARPLEVVDGHTRIEIYAVVGTVQAWVPNAP